MLSSLVLGLGLLLGLATSNAADTGSVSGSVTAAAPKNLPNTLIFVKTGDKGGKAPKTAKMDQSGLIFVPRVLPIAAGSTVQFSNSDAVGHSVFTLDGEKYDLGTWKKGEIRSYTFTKTGVYRQLCKVHDDMIAYIVVLDTDHYALTDTKGAFKLEGLPPGDYTLGVWSEKLGSPDIPVHVTAGQAATVTIPLGAK